MSYQNKNYVLPIAMMFALFFMIAFVTGLQNPMAIIVKNQFQSSNFLSQLGNFSVFIAYAFMGIPAGILLQKIGYKKTALLAIGIGFIGVAVIFFSGKVELFGVYLLGAFISGFSMCMLNTVVNPMLNTLGGGGKKGNQLLQFGGALNSMGATIVPIFVGLLVGQVTKDTSISSTNPALFLAMVIFVLAFLVFYFIRIPEPHLEKNDEVKGKQTHSPLSFRHFVLGAVAIFLYVGMEVGIPNIGNLYMTEELKINVTVAGSVVGTYWFLMLVGRLVGGVIGARVSSKAMLSFVSFLGLLLVLLAIFTPKDITINMPVFQSDISFGFAQVPMSMMLLILCGLCTSVMWGSIFNLATGGLGKYTAAASGIFMVMVCGGGVLPAIQAIFADKFGYVDSYFIIALGFIYMIFYTFIGSKNVNQDIEA